MRPRPPTTIKIIQVKEMNLVDNLNKLVTKETQVLCQAKYHTLWSKNRNKNYPLLIFSLEINNHKEIA